MSKIDAARRLYTETPKVTIEKVMKALGYKKTQQLFAVRSTLKKQGMKLLPYSNKHPQQKKKISVPKRILFSSDTYSIKRLQSRLRISICISPTGMELKLRDDSVLGNVIGTLNITQTGLTFKKAKSKKNSGRELSWRILERIGDLGL